MVKALVVDTGAILKGQRLDHLSEKFYTVPEVMKEVRDKQSVEFLNQLPLEWHIREPSASAYKHVVDFSKKTGDLSVLSKVDLKVLALTLDLEKEHRGDLNHLRTEPLRLQTQVGSGPSLNESLENLKIDEKKLEEGNAEEKENKEIIEEQVILSNESNIDLNKENETENQKKENDQEDEDDDGWITPKNVAKLKQKEYMGGQITQTKEEPVLVSCITSDFAMQNVLLQLGLSLMSLDGYHIKHIKNWVLRCHACYHITKEMNKKFCPKCGNQTLMRTSCRIDPQTGQITLYLKKNFQYRLRGTKYSIPKPHGGRIADLVFREDQKEFQRGVQYQERENQKLEKSNVDVFDVEYIPSMLQGGRSGGRNLTKQGMSTVVGFGRKNPNEAKRRIHKKKN